MNLETREINTAQGWAFTDENGVVRNYVEEGKVVPVVWNEHNQYWEEKTC
jgi:hypothetical protein